MKIKIIPRYRLVQGDKGIDNIIIDICMIVTVCPMCMNILNLNRAVKCEAENTKSSGTR